MNKKAKKQKEDAAAPPALGKGVVIGHNELRLDQVQIIRNTRRAIDEPSDLAASFRAEGGETSGQLVEIGVEILDPTKPTYALIHGHRRYRAAQLEGWTKIRATLWDMQGSNPIFKQLAENGQRTEVGAIEEAEGFLYMIEELGMTQAEIARRYGCDRSYVNQRLKSLTDLAPEVIKLVGQGDGKLSFGKAYALTQIEETEQLQIAQSALRHGWSERRVKEQVKAVRMQTAKLKQETTAQPTELIIPEPVQLPHLKLKADLSKHEITQLAVWALIRNGMDQEVLDYLKDNFFEFEDVWGYVGLMNEDEAEATLEFLVRRYAEAAHRYTSIDKRMIESLGAEHPEALTTLPRERWIPPMPVKIGLGLPAAREDDDDR